MSGGHRGLGRWMIFGAAFLWGATATVARLVFRDHSVPPMTVVVVRLTIACALLFLWIALRDPRGFRVARGDWIYLVVLGTFGVAAVQASYYQSIARLGVGVSILIQYLAPAILVAVATLRGKRLRPITLGAVIGACLGTLFLVGGVGPEARSATVVDWVIGASSAVSFAFFIGYSKRGLRRYPPLTVLFYSFLVAAVLWSFFTPPARIIAAGYDAGVWSMFVVIGLGSTLLPFVLFYEGLRRLPADEAALLATLEPVVAVLMAATFLGEPLHSWQWFGAALVLTAAVLAGRQSPEESALTTERL